MINFPDAPTLGQQFTVPNGGSWIWDGAKWTGGGPPSVQYMPLTGGQMTGALLVESPQILAGEAVSKSYVDTGFNIQRRNRLINGNFLVNQYNADTVITPVSSQFICDRWRTGIISQAGKFTGATFNTNVPGAPIFRGISFTSTSAYASVAADGFVIVQPIEYVNCADLQWGASNAVPVTLSFWALTNTTVGTYSGSFRNNASNRSYPFQFTINAVNVWQFFSITIPGDTTGTWVPSSINSGCIYFTIDLGSGSNARGPANSWSSNSYTGVTGSISLVGINGCNLRLANIQLEAGSQASPYDFRSIETELLLCQRYYQTIYASVRYYAPATLPSYAECTLAYTTMRAAPTATLITAGSGNIIAANYPMVNSINPQNARYSLSASATGDCYALNYLYSLSAEL